MAERVISLGAVDLGSTIEGQMCLAPLPYDYDSNPDAFYKAEAETWIFVNDDGSNVGADTSYPCDMELDQMIELYWRAKRIEISIELSWSTSFDSGTDFVTLVLGRSVAIPAEEDIVKPHVWSVESFSGDVITADGYLFESGPDNTRVKVVGASYYPYFYLNINGVHFQANTDSSVQSYPEAHTGKIVLSGVGNEVSIPFYLDTQNIYTYSSVTFDMEVKEWWEHANPDGTPKYNTTTGVKLP